MKMNKNTQKVVHTKRDSLPVINCDLNADYLSHALQRAGRESVVDDIDVQVLTEGRQSNKVWSLKSKSAGAYVLKTFPQPNWRDAVFGKGNGETSLWQYGVTRHLASPLHCPTIDIAFCASQNEEWMLMEDVSHGIMARGIYDEKRLRWLLKALAELHAQYWEKDEQLLQFPIIPLETHVAYFAEPILALAGRIEPTGWVTDAVENITVLRPFVPVFLEILGDDAAFYLDLCQHRDIWVSALAQSPQTLTHGDIRRANVAPINADTVSLFDWDMASRAPAACDLAWFWFLHFWCYSPRDGLDVLDREPLREYYIEKLAFHLRERFDREEFERAWDLSWLKSFVQLGFCLIDPVVDSREPLILEDVRGRVRRAVEEAQRIVIRYALY